LEIVAGRFQNKRFADLPGRMFGAVAQFVPERKRNPHAIPVLPIHCDIAVQPKTPLRPARRVTL